MKNTEGDHTAESEAPNEDGVACPHGVNITTHDCLRCADIAQRPILDAIMALLDAVTASQDEREYYVSEARASVERLAQLIDGPKSDETMLRRINSAGGTEPLDTRLIDGEA